MVRHLLTPGQVIGNVDNPPVFVGHYAIVKHGKTERSRRDGGLDAVMSSSPHLEVKRTEVRRAELETVPKSCRKSCGESLDMFP